MAIGWLTVLNLVPWTDLMGNAPKIVDGANKLWKAVTNKEEAGIKDSTSIKSDTSPNALSLAVFNVKSRLSTLEANVADLKQEMVSSAELIKSLADQNSRLTLAVENLHIRIRQLFFVTSIVGVLAITSIFLLLVRS